MFFEVGAQREKFESAPKCQDVTAFLVHHSTKTPMFKSESSKMPTEHTIGEAADAGHLSASPSSPMHVSQTRVDHT